MIVVASASKKLSIEGRVEEISALIISVVSVHVRTTLSRSMESAANLKKKRQS